MCMQRSFVPKGVLCGTNMSEHCHVSWRCICKLIFCNKSVLCGANRFEIYYVGIRFTYNLIFCSTIVLCSTIMFKTAVLNKFAHVI
jgi:hypothetical protein